LSFRRGFKAEANRIALRIREQMSLSPLAPIDPVEVCARFDIQVIRLSELDNSSPFLGRSNSAFSAVTVPCGWHTAIVHNDSHHPYRQRSNICHELAHCFLGHECTPPLTESGERARDGGMEAEANYLAGTLLVTNEAAKHVVRQGLISEAQRMYGISGPMLNYRLPVSGAHTIHRRSLGLAG
jgi:Zn-dependent peptidase ImmA (M78 family)